jgi:excisionase family DNA binding protein
MQAEDLIDLLAERIAARVVERMPKPQAAAPQPPQPAQYLTTKQAAALLGLGASTLELWRAEGKGPNFHKLPGAGGAVRYSARELEAWLAAHARKSK